MPPLRARTFLHENKIWKNHHVTVSKRPVKRYDLYNARTDDLLGAYNATTKRLQAFIREAVREGRRLRAYGGGWSLSEVMATDGIMINTKPLRLKFPIAPENVAAKYPENPKYLYFLQCGNSILGLNKFFKKKKLSLKTSGSSNGQTIVGAISTGTHGSAIDFGALQEFVVGIHVVASSVRHVWIERKSYPVMKPRFARLIGRAVVIRDDTLFNAALVNLGSLGLVHGVMVETRQRFLLEAYRERLDYDEALKKTVSTLDFSELPLEHRPERPHHFEVVFNPNERTRKPFVTYMYDRKYFQPYPPPDIESEDLGLGDGALEIIGYLVDLFPAVTEPFINSMAEDEYPLFREQYGTIGEIFSNEKTQGKTLSAAIGVSLDQAEKALEAAFSAYREHGKVFGGFITLRYVKGSQALLAFTKFPQTALLEIDGLHSPDSIRFLKRIWKKLDEDGIPFTVHWGKINAPLLNEDRVKSMYDSALDAWKASRRELLKTASVRDVFKNDFVENAGLV